MEFLDISLTKDSSLLLHALQSPFYCRILKKIILFSGSKNLYTKSAKQENSILFMNSRHFVEGKNEGRLKIAFKNRRVGHGTGGFCNNDVTST
jgi:hypothetical protein